MLRLLVRTLQVWLSAQRWPAEIASRARAEAFSEFAPASFSCRGWWHLRARFAFERAENPAAHSGVRTAADESLDRKSTRLNSSHANISYAVFCLKKKKTGRKRRKEPQRTPRRGPDGPARKKRAAADARAP